MSLMEWLVGKPQTSKDVALLQGRPVSTRATINMVPRVAAIEPQAGGPGIEEDRGHFVLGQTLIDTLVPHARNPAPSPPTNFGTSPTSGLLPCAAMTEGPYSKSSCATKARAISIGGTDELCGKVIQKTEPRPTPSH
jgi:hypothetical protein